MKPGPIVVLKLSCYIVIGGLTPMVTGIAQWLGTGEWPPAINWVGILAGCAVGAATQALAFLSKTYSDWESGRESNSNGRESAIRPELK